jgi:branched-chain amino acid transport system permease protein
MAFGVSSFFAGVCGALIAPVFSSLNPQGTFGLELSILFIVMVIIGGVGTVAGAIMGTVFVQLVPAAIDFLVNRYDFIPLVTDNINEGGWVIATPQLELVLYGLSIILFLLFEPLGLFGIWMRVRNYFAAWPFSY